MQFSRIAAAAGVAILIQILPAGAEDMTVADEIKAARIALDQAFQKHDRAAIQKMVTADHLAVTTYYGKPFTTADELAGITEFVADYFDFTEGDVTVFSPDAAMITFENFYKGTFRGRPLPEHVFVSEIWLKQDGAWKQQLYQETPIAP